MKYILRETGRWMRILILLIPVLMVSACGDDDDDDNNDDDNNGPTMPDPDPDPEGRIRIVAVDPAGDQFTIENFTDDAVNINSYQICSLFQYAALSSLTVESGNLNLAAGAQVTLSGWPLDDSASDVGLYTGSAFSNPDAMEDYMQYGDSGIGRESVAVQKGIWTAGQAVEGAGPFAYSGDGSEDGAGFWD